eukprot:812706_1
MAMIRYICDSKDPDVFLFQEQCVTYGDANFDEIFMDGYLTLPCVGQYGKCVILVKEDLRHRVFDLNIQPNQSISPQFERYNRCYLTGIEIENYLLICGYRTQNIHECDANQFFDPIRSVIEQYPTKKIILGCDINAHNTRWMNTASRNFNAKRT